MRCGVRATGREIGRRAGIRSLRHAGVGREMARTRSDVMGALTSGTPAQFVRFCAVGGIGYVTNLVVFAPLVRFVHTPYLLAACIAYACGWVVALIGHRHWTFGERETSVVGQGFRYFVVSALVLAADLVVLHVLVVAGVETVLAQAIALAVVTPLSFGLNRIWAFAAR